MRRSEASEIICSQDGSYLDTRFKIVTPIPQSNMHVLIEHFVLVLDYQDMED